MRKAIALVVVVVVASSLFAAGTIGGGLGVPMVSMSQNLNATESGTGYLGASLEVYGSNEFFKDGKIGHGIGYRAGFGIGSARVGLQESATFRNDPSFSLRFSVGYQLSYAFTEKDTLVAGLGCGFLMPIVRGRTVTTTAGVTTTVTNTDTFFYIGPYLEIGALHAFSKGFSLAYGVIVDMPIYAGAKLKSVTTTGSTSTTNTVDGVCAFPKGMSIIPSVSALCTY